LLAWPYLPREDSAPVTRRRQGQNPWWRPAVGDAPAGAAGLRCESFRRRSRRGQLTRCPLV